MTGGHSAMRVEHFITPAAGGFKVHFVSLMCCISCKRLLKMVICKKILLENLNERYDCISSALLNIGQVDKYLRDPTVVYQ